MTTPSISEEWMKRYGPTHVEPYDRFDPKNRPFKTVDKLEWPDLPHTTYNDYLNNALEFGVYPGQVLKEFADGDK